MTQHLSLGDEDRADDVDRDDGTHEIAADLAYRRLIMVNVMFFGLPHCGDRNWVLIDTGLAGTKTLIKRAAEARFGAGSRPSAIILTHGHFDHVGAVEDLAREWDVPVYAHAAEHPYLSGQASYPAGDPSVGGGLMARLAGFYPTRPVDISDRLRALPQDGQVPGMPGWTWLHTPGHSPGHISLWRDDDRSLIVGDAFVTTAPESAYATALQSPEIHGPPRYFTIDWEDSRSSVRTLAGLEPELVITGHGRAMQGPRMTDALQTLAREFDSVAVPRHGVYVERPATTADGSAYKQASEASPVKLARGLGWFSIALGAIELLAPRALSTMLGLQGHDHLLQAYGAREIATGLGTLSARDPTPWIWGRVAGDALDLATLAGNVGESRSKMSMSVALVAVAGVTALDIICAKALEQGGRRYDDREARSRPASDRAQNAR